MGTCLCYPLAVPDAAPRLSGARGDVVARAGEGAPDLTERAREAVVARAVVELVRHGQLGDRRDTCAREDDNGIDRTDARELLRALLSNGHRSWFCDDARGTSRGAKSRVSRQKQLMGTSDMVSMWYPNTACDLSRPFFIRDAFRARRRADGDARERAHD
jgi:hypothetical protein